MSQDFSKQVGTYAETTREALLWRWVLSITGLFVLAVLFPLSRFNYLLFHGLIELSSIIVAITVFSISWNTRDITRNESFTLLGIAFLAIGSIDLLHTLAYKGMNIFPGDGADPPTQLWIAARAMEAAAYLLAALRMGKTTPLHAWRCLFFWLFSAMALALSIWPLQFFPTCFIDGLGLTSFKVAAEYLICSLMLISIILFWNHSRRMEQQSLRLLIISIALTILSEMAFTLYRDVYGFSNFMGHVLKLVSVAVLYRALIMGSLRRPYQTLFRDLAQSHSALNQELLQRQQIEEELRVANQDLDTFVRTASHDLRSPLTVIMGSAELLQSELGDRLEQKHLEMLGMIRSQGSRMVNLLGDLLAMARIGHIDQTAEIVQTELVAAQVVEDLHKEIVARQCRVKIVSIPPIKAHHSLIYQLLLNLISNAVRHGANPACAVEIGGSTNTNGVSLFVRDHGPGIPAEERQHIFDAFYRCRPRESNNPDPGTGLGLAIVQKIVHYYCGQIIVEDTPGGGTTFRLEFPADMVQETQVCN